MTPLIAKAISSYCCSAYANIIRQRMSFFKNKKNQTKITVIVGGGEYFGFYFEDRPL